MMTPTLLKNLETAASRFDDIEKKMSESQSADAWQALTVEYKKLSPLVGNYRLWRKAQHKLSQLDELKQDPELSGLVAEEEEQAKKDGDKALMHIKQLLSPTAANH